MAKEIPAVILKKLLSSARASTLAGDRAPGSGIPNNLTSFFNISLSQIRASGRVLEAIRTLARVHGDVSAAVSAMLRLAGSPLRSRVYDPQHQLSPEGSDLLRSIIVRMEHLSDYSQGYDDRPSFLQVQNSLLRSLILTGSCALELVLDKALLPHRLQPVSTETLKWQAGKNKRVVPFQTSATGQGEKIDLDIPTFFYASLDQDANSAWSASPIEPALNNSFFHAETVEDIRRVVKRSGHSRLMIKIKIQDLLNNAPSDIRYDPVQLAGWVEGKRIEIRDEIEKLDPESALVFFDTLEANYLNSEIGASADYKSLMETIDSILATALKTPAAVVGKRHSTGSQNTSSTESLLFIKTAMGLHAPVETLLSRVLTLAVRLFGFQGYVSANFDPVDLRPEVELEAFKTMSQNRILDLLSLGFYTDQEAAELLHTGPRAPEAPSLSGTMFHLNTASASGTSSASGASGASDIPSPNADPARRALTTDTPKAGGGSDNRVR